MADTTAESGVNIPTLDISKLMMSEDAANTIKLLSTANPALADKLGATAQAGLMAQITTAANANMEAKKKEAEAAAASASDSALVQQLKNRQIREQQLVVQRTADSIVTPDQIAQLSGRVHQADAVLDAELDNINKRAHTGIFENPLAWLYNQFTLPDAQNAYNVGVAQRNALAEQRDGAVAAGTDAARYINATHLNATAEIVDAENKQAISEAQKKIAAAQAELSTASIPYMQLESQLISQGVGQRLAEANYRLSAASAASSLKTAEMQRKLLQFTLTDRDSEDHAIQVINAKTGNNFNNISFNALPPKVKEAYHSIAIQAVTGDTLSPFQTFKNWNDVNANIKNPRTRALFLDMQSYMAQAAAEVSRDAQLRTPEAKAEAMETKFNLHYNSVNALPIDDSRAGYGMPSFGELHASSFAPALEQVPLWGQVLKQFATNPETRQTSVSSQQLVTTAADLLRKKEITPDQFAAQLATIGLAIVGFNAKYTDASSLGAPLQTRMIVNVPQFAGRFLSGSNVSLDLTNPAQLKNYAMRMQAAGVMAGMSEPISAIGEAMAATEPGLRVKARN